METIMTILLVLLCMLFLGCGAGPKGDPGAQGLQGIQGAPGEDAFPCTVTAPKKGCVVVYCPDGSKEVVKGTEKNCL